MTRNGLDPGRGSWIFQGNPERYTLLRNLTTEASELWNMRQHASRVCVGDRVYIWISGEDAGIYATGTVMTPPIVCPDSAVGIRSWTDPQEGRRSRPRVELRYDRLLVDRPLLKVLLRTDPLLRDLTIIQAPRATNYPLSETEAEAIEEWLAAQP